MSSNSTATSSDSDFWDFDGEDKMMSFFKQQRGPMPKLLNSLDMKGVTEYIASDKCNNIIVMCGAGLSTAAGIPDFRSPIIGLYATLKRKYNLEHPEDIFDIDDLVDNPSPFFEVAKLIYPGDFKPTVGHYFIKLLDEKGLLKRVYTQNIDTLEHRAGISEDKLVEAHGSFRTAHCMDCKAEYSEEYVKELVFADEIPRCKLCEQKGIIKPDIVFFGEKLPSRFYDLHKTDFKSCDLVLIMGTSLSVKPFSNLHRRVENHVPRVLLNMEKCGSGMDYCSKNAYRDVFIEGKCDELCTEICERLGWKDQLDELVASASTVTTVETPATAVEAPPTTITSAQLPGATDSNGEEDVPVSIFGQLSITATTEVTSKTHSIAEDSSTAEEYSTAEELSTFKDCVTCVNNCTNQRVDCSASEELTAALVSEETGITVPTTEAALTTD